MSTAADTGLQSYRDAFDSIAAAAPRLQEVREHALERFLQRGFPGTRDEDWRYVNLRPLGRRRFSLAAPTASLDGAGIDRLALAGINGHRLVFIDGRLSRELSDGGGMDGLRLGPVDGTTIPAPQAGDDGSAFSDLSTAFLGEGCVIDIAAGCSLEKPLYLLFASTSSEQAVMSHPRVMLKLGKAASASLVEHHVSVAEDENLFNIALDLELAAGAGLSHTRIQDASQRSFHIGRIAVDQQRDSRYQNHNIVLGGAIGRTDLEVRLRESGAEVLLNGLLMGHGKQQLDTHTRVDHLAPNTHSRETYRGVMDGSSRGVFNGKVIVHPDAQKIEAHQSSNNLLLSEKAEIDTKPELEIYADDVKCSHGATVGQLDNDAMFYLLTRGIDTETARGLLVFAFADDVVAQLPMGEVRQAMERRIVGRLPDGDRLKEFV